MFIAKGTALALLPLLVASTSPVSAQEAAAKTETASLSGYGASASSTERDWEAKFRALPRPITFVKTCAISAPARTMSVSPYDRIMPMDSRPLQAVGPGRGHRDFLCALSHTQRARLELVAPTSFKAKLQEPPVAEDPTSNQQAEQLPTYQRL